MGIERDMGGPLVVFLDFDGVISSPRAHMAHEDIAEHDVRWIDPIACKLIARLQRAHGFRLVISSTWRGFGRDRCAAVLRPYGLDACLHEDWATNHWPDGSRPAELDDWLDRNGRPSYAIFDDDAFAWTEEQRSRWVQSCCYNGFQCHNFAEADRLLKRLAAPNTPETPNEPA